MKIDASFVLAESSRPEWRKECALPPNSFPLLMLELSQDESFVVGTFMTGFQLWNSTEDNRQVHETQFATLRKNLHGRCVTIFTRGATCIRPPRLSKLSLFPHAQIPRVNAPQLKAQTNFGYIASTFRRCTTLRLPSGIRNIATKTNKSNSCVLSAGHVYAVAGTIIRR